jgi:hypothetical protein
MRKIRRFGSAVGAALATLILTTLPAAAQNYPPKPTTETVAPKEVVVSEGEIAFTGTDLILLIAVVAVLLLAGAAALIVARRRAITVSP